MKTALIIPCFNRPAELKQCLDSVKAAIWPTDAFLILADDCSTDQETKRILSEFNIPDVHIIRNYSGRNYGIREVLRMEMDFAFNILHADTVINLDSDAIVKPDFFKVLLKEKMSWPQYILTGFHSINKNRDGSERHKIIRQEGNIILKESVGGINMVMNKLNYLEYVRPALLKEGNWDHNASIAAYKDGYPMACITPSVVQHLATKSSMGHAEEPDIACDFYNLHLPDVTLFGIDTKNPEGLKAAAEISQRDIKFGAVKLFTDLPINSKEDYSKYMMKNLRDEFSTRHVLIFQADGYVVNYKAWDPEFLQYDYIGATWIYKDNMNVGNGGFSLRSWRLMDIVSCEKGISMYHPEDHMICRVHRKLLENKYGIKFAPEEVANRFAIEAYGGDAIPESMKYSGQFGFHGYRVNFSGWNLPHIPKRLNRPDPRLMYGKPMRYL